MKKSNDRDKGIEMDFSHEEIAAIKETITHWERDIQAKLEEGVKIYTGKRETLKWADNRQEVQCYANASALCRFSTHDKSIDCAVCPLYRFHKMTCSDRHSDWFAFISNPSLSTCDNMILTLLMVLDSVTNKAVDKPESDLLKQRQQVKGGVFCTVKSDGTVTDEGIVDEMLENEDTIREQLIKAGVIKNIVLTQRKDIEGGNDEDSKNKR